MIEITGRVKHKALVEEFVMNLTRHLKMDHRKKWSIEVQFVRKCEDNALGLCYDDAEKEIVIEIARMCFINPDYRMYNFYEQMQTLAHEMVHAKQFIEGDYPSEKEAKKLEHTLFAQCFPWKELP
jgi:hypothetical protein